MTLQPHHGGNHADNRYQKQRNHNSLRAYLPCQQMPYGIGAAWTARNRAENGVIAP